jgi:hypothetical protein
MANEKVCISSDIIENVKAMKDRAVLTQIQAFGDFLSGKFNDFQYNAINQSMEKVVSECQNILDALTDNQIDSVFVPQAEKIAHAMMALAKVA